MYLRARTCGSLGELARRHLGVDPLAASVDRPRPRAGRHRATRRRDPRGSGGRRGVEGHVDEVPLVALRVAEEVLPWAGGGGAGGVAWEALDQRPRRRVGPVVLGLVRRQPADRDAAASLGARGGARAASGAAAARQKGWVVVFVASYFSSTDVSNELCAANDYDRETLVDQLIH